MREFPEHVNFPQFWSLLYLLIGNTIPSSSNRNTPRYLGVLLVFYRLFHKSYIALDSRLSEGGVKIDDTKTSKKHLRSSVSKIHFLAILGQENCSSKNFQQFKTLFDQCKYVHTYVGLFHTLKENDFCLLQNRNFRIGPRIYVSFSQVQVFYCGDRSKVWMNGTLLQSLCFFLWRILGTN